MRWQIFYSWQSDLPNATNRAFIQQALENAGKAIGADKTIEVEPVIDRDTQGVAGAPDIAKTIFEKIKAADVFVADVSIIGGRRKGRPTSHPNVLIELGYALHALGDERVLLVFNAAYGKVEQLPFDLKMRRVIPYNMPEPTPDRATERRAMEGRLGHAIRVAMKSPKAVVPDSVPDLDARRQKHVARAIPELERSEDFGHVGIYCFPYGQIGISVRDLEEFVTKHCTEFSQELRDCGQPEPFQSGISLGSRPWAFQEDIKSTARFTLYRDGLIAFDALADKDMGRDAQFANTLHLYWLSYEIQRHLQLAKAILSDYGAARVRTIVELDHIEKFSLLVSAGPRYPCGIVKHPYVGTHEPILLDVDLMDVHAHDSPKRNTIMQPVRDIIGEACRIFGLSPTPSDVSDEDGQLLYAKGHSGR
jgi:hypothetical protein